MRQQDYKENIINKVIYDSPGYIKQNFIKNIIKSGIGTYKKDDRTSINLSCMMKDDKIYKCFNESNETYYLFDYLEMKKIYKYSILYSFEDINIDKLAELGFNIEGKGYIDDYEEDLIKKPLYLDDEKKTYIKFHKEISFWDTKGSSPVNRRIRYPIVFIFHKKFKIMEIRFDRLYFNGDEDFYKKSMETHICWIKNNLCNDIENIDLDAPMKYICENYKEDVKELVWSFELAKSKGITLKTGTDNIMPFISDLEDILEKEKGLFSSTEETIKCREIIEKYLKSVKRFANSKYRLLSWIDKSKSPIDETKLDYNIMTSEQVDDCELEENNIDMRVVFNYRNRMLDLIEWYDCKENSLERIEYVIRFIGKVARDIKEL